MGEIVNLNKFRKAKTRDAKRKEADENSVRFGRNKSEKAFEQSVQEKDAQHLDNHKLDE